MQKPWITLFEGWWKISVWWMNSVGWIVSGYDKTPICSNCSCMTLNESFPWERDRTFSLSFTSPQTLGLREQWWNESDECLCMIVCWTKKKRKEKKNRENETRSLKETSERHCTIPRLISEIFKAKKMSEIPRKDVIIQFFFVFFKPTGASLLEKKKLHMQT